MNKTPMSVALAFAAALAVSVVPVRADVTVGAAGNAINSTVIVPSGAGTLACADVVITTNSATLALAARSAGIRTGLYAINSSTMVMTAGSRPPDVIILPDAASYVMKSAALFGTTPGMILHPATNPSASSASLPQGDSRLDQRGSGVYQGAIYAVAESTAGTTNVSGHVKVCEFY